MKTPLSLKVAPRTQTGRSASRRLRKVNRIPAILYGKHSDPEKLSIEVPEFTRLLKSVAGRSLLIELNRDDKPDKSLSFLQEIQRDPITDRYLHVDLHEVKPDEKFEIRVPVRVTGESFGVKNQSGVLEIASHVLRIKCLPSDLPEIIEVDVTPLNVGQTIKVGELKPIAGVVFLDDKGQPVVSCVEPVAEIVQEVVAAEVPAEGTPEAAAAAAAAAAATGEAGAAPAGDGKAAPAADAKAAAPGDKKAAAPAAGAKPGAPAPGAKPGAPAPGAKPGAPAAGGKPGTPGKK
jgi:large subunit ribosomal protein L25